MFFFEFYLFFIFCHLEHIPQSPFCLTFSFSMKFSETVSYFSLEDASFSESTPMQFVRAQWLWLEGCTWSKLDHIFSRGAVGTTALAGGGAGAGRTRSEAGVTWGLSPGARAVTALVKARSVLEGMEPGSRVLLCGQNGPRPLPGSVGVATLVVGVSPGPRAWSHRPAFPWCGWVGDSTERGPELEGLKTEPCVSLGFLLLQWQLLPWQGVGLQRGSWSQNLGQAAGHVRAGLVGQQEPQTVSSLRFCAGAGNKQVYASAL